MGAHAGNWWWVASRGADPLLSFSPVPCEIGARLGRIEGQAENTV